MDYLDKTCPYFEWQEANLSIHKIMKVFHIDETGVNLQELKSEIRKAHANDVERVKNYKQYYTKFFAETGKRPSKFVPEEGYTLDRILYKGTPIEMLTPMKKTKRVIYFFKGCGYCNYFTDAANEEMQRVIKRIEDTSVMGVNYRVAPENTYKETLEDTVNGFQWLLEQGFAPENIIFMGDSSGGGTAIQTARMLRDKGMPLPESLVLFSPWTNVAMDTPSYQEFNDERDCVLGGNGLMEFFSSCCLELENPHNPYISACYGDFSDMPRMLIQTAMEERAYDDVIMIGNKMLDCDREIQVEVYKDMFHEFQFHMELESAKKAWEQVIEFIK